MLSDPELNFDKNRGGGTGGLVGLALLPNFCHDQMKIVPDGRGKIGIPFQMKNCGSGSPKF